MSKRSYQQLCPIAYSLDLVGERWTLLLVRELKYGPRRFTDLFRALPGIGKNLLTTRLRNLESIGVLSRRTLPPPLPATVYELAPYGHSLLMILDELTSWGLPHLISATPVDYLSVPALMNALSRMFDPGAAAGVELVVEFRVDNELFHALVRDGELILAVGPATDPDLITAADARTMLSLVAKKMTPNTALGSEALTILHGSTAQLTTFISLFKLPNAAAPTNGNSR